MSDKSIKITTRDGVCHLSGILNEYADLSSLTKQPTPLTLNLREVSRLNSIGIRNLLKFLHEFGDKPLTYVECPSEFVDQINMIPGLLGVKRQGVVASLFVPYECTSCGHEEDLLADTEPYRQALKSSQPMPQRSCPRCKSPMAVINDSFFVFLNK